VLALPRTLNPAISSEIETAILAALELHPNDRPPSVAAWARTLAGDAPTRPVAVRAEPVGWGQALRQYWWLLLLALSTVAAAVIVTFR